MMFEKLEEIVEKVKISGKRLLIRGLIVPTIFASTSFISCNKKSDSNIVGAEQNVPPQTEIISGPSGTINNDNARFEWKGSDEDGYIIKYKYSLIPTNHNNITTTNTSVEFGNMSNNSYTFKVAAQDNDEEWDPTPATRGFTVNLEGTGESSGTTNTSGDVSLTVNSNDFQIHVQSQTTGASLDDITVSGVYNGNSIYSFLAEDFSDRSDPYFSEIVYTTSGGLGRVNETNDVIDINLLLSSINPYHFNIRDRTINNFQSNPNLEYIVTTTLSNLDSWYRYYDTLFNNISLLEFIANVFGRAEFTVAVEAAKFRQTFIENVDKFSRIVDHIAQKFGTNYDPDAHYYDLYRHKTLGILTHFENNDDYATLKGNVTDVETGQPILGVTIQTWGSNPSTGFSTTDENGNYIIIRLLEGNYTFATSSIDYYGDFFDKTLVAPTPPNYVSNYLDISLNPVTTTTLDSLIIQPKNGAGKDAEILRQINLGYVGGDPVWDTTNVDDNYGNTANFFVEDIKFDNYEIVAKFFVEFDLSSLLSNIEINSATFSIYGTSVEGQDYVPAIISIKKVISSWSEDEITWNNQPNIGQEISHFSTTFDHKKYSSEITDAVKEWNDETKPNYGLVLEIREPGNKQHFWGWTSDYYIDTPKLKIVYIP